MFSVLVLVAIVAVSLGILSAITAAAFAGTEPTAQADEAWIKDFIASTDKAIAELRNR